MKKRTKLGRQLVREYFDVLSLYYEDDIQNDRLIAYRKVCKHLGLRDHNVQIRLMRVNTKTLRELVENFNELEASLSGTHYEWMLTA